VIELALNSIKVQRQYKVNNLGLTQRQCGFAKGLAGVVQTTVKVGKYKK